MDDRHPPLGRRAVVGTLVVALAGCSEGATTGTESTAATSPGTTDSTAASGSDGAGSTAGPTTTTNPSSLDLSEANVVGVETTGTDGGVRFDVTLHHDDDGESGYADWWQVESPAGDRLGRRDLAHAHGTRPFTRSATIEVPDSLDCVVVRGHDQTHGYGGRAMLVAPASGATTVIEQGADPVSEVDEPCP